MIVTVRWFHKRRMIVFPNFFRCMFGSDWPVCRLTKDDADYEDVVKLLMDIVKDRSHSEKKAIFQNTVIDFYGLKDVVDV